MGKFATLIVVVFIVFCWREGFTGHVEAQQLQQRAQACGTGNSIDDCWRCSGSPWDEDRKKLAGCAQGFGARATGGSGGSYYTVTDPGDNAAKPEAGTLRFAVIQDEPLWITFQSDMAIKLEGQLYVSSNTTIDGRGANVSITGYGCLAVENAENVIIHGIHVHDCKRGGAGEVAAGKSNHTIHNSGGSGDGILVSSSKDVWIDHCSLTNCVDGLIDVVNNSTSVTISNNHLSRHSKTMLFGNSDAKAGDKNSRVTVAYNRFGQGLIQRLPRCRWGRFHVVNNYYESWGIYAIGGSANPSILSQSNVYNAPDNANAKEVTKRMVVGDEWKNWNWLSDGDQFLNGATFVPSGSTNISDYKEMMSMEAKAASKVNAMTADAGALSRRPSLPCAHADTSDSWTSSASI